MKYLSDLTGQYLNAPAGNKRILNSTLRKVIEIIGRKIRSGKGLST